MTRPTASPSGQNRCAIASLMMVTGTLSGPSVSLKCRPRTIGIDAASKNAGPTADRSERNPSRSRGGVWPSTLKRMPVDMISSGMLSIMSTVWMPGSPSNRSSNRRT